MSVDKKISYEDQRLTEKQKKKIKPVNQGGGPNYLGKQETVTVPKKWLSDPDHVIAELAYITPREKKILLDENLYGSLKGKPNKGPAGIQSLQGDMGSVGGGNTGGNGGNNDGPSARERHMGLQGKTGKKDPSIGGGSGPERDTRLEDIRQQKIKDKIKEELLVTPVGRNKPLSKLGLYNANFQRNMNIKLAQKRALQKYKDIEQYTDLMDEYGLTAEEIADKVANDPSYGYDFGELEKGLETLTSNRNTSIESTRPNLYDVNSTLQGRFALFNPVVDKIRPDTQVTALNTLNKARDYTDLVNTADTMTNQDIRDTMTDLANRGKTEDQINPRDGGGNEIFLPITPYQQDVVAQEPELPELSELQGLLANRVAYRFMADGGRASFQQGSPAPIAPKVDPRMARSLQENIATNEAQRTANITRKEAQTKAIQDIRNAISSGGKEGLGSFLQQQFGVANPSQVPGYSSYSSPLSGVSSFAKDKITNALIQNYLNPSAQGSSSVYDQMRFAAPGQSGSFVEMEGGQFGNGMGIVIDGKQYATEQDAIDDVGLERYNMFYADGGRVGLMGGGMPDDFIGGLADGNLDEMGRQMYGLGKLVKKATRAVKKIVKSPVGKAALLYAGTGGLGNLAAGKGFGSMFSNFLSPSKFLSTVPGIFTKGGLQNIASRIGLGSFKNTGSQRLFEANKLGSLLGSPLGMITAASALSGLMTKSEEDENENEEETYYRGPGLDIEAIRRDPYGNKRSAYRFYADGGDVKEPVAKDTMPLLDMNGMEKDYRADGGFVPIGRMERADDVPARLSKNEFVFTADAVRNAGDGDVDKGAEVMYNMMKNLESGGKVSEESQGLDGARDMFQTSKRLEEVL